MPQGLGMAESNKPLVAVITRLVPQKGIPLIKAALYRWGEGGGGRGGSGRMHQGCAVQVGRGGGCRGRMREQDGGR